MGHGNTLYYGDNLDILRRYVEDESVDLLYLDPPVNSNRTVKSEGEVFWGETKERRAFLDRYAVACSFTRTRVEVS